MTAESGAGGLFPRGSRCSSRCIHATGPAPAPECGSPPGSRRRGREKRGQRPKNCPTDIPPTRAATPGRDGWWAHRGAEGRVRRAKAEPAPGAWPSLRSRSRPAGSSARHRIRARRGCGRPALPGRSPPDAPTSPAGATGAAPVHRRSPRRSLSPATSCSSRSPA